MPKKKNLHIMKSSLALRMILLGFAMIYGVYICSAFIRRSDRQRIGVVEEEASTTPAPSGDLRIPPSEIPFVHYPKPTKYSREECGCTPVRLFAILSMQRSGSGWFETLLNSHVNISSNGEIFFPLKRRDSMASILRTLNKVYNLDWHNRAAKNECTAAFGFKWMLNQGIEEHPKEIAKYFKEKGVHVIFLFRRNLLRRLVSVRANLHDQNFKVLQGIHKAHVLSKEEAGILERYKPLINTRSLISDLNKARESIIDALKCFENTRHIILFYEDLVKNQTKLVDVLEFLRLPRQALVSQHIKIHTKPLEKQIKNWKAVHNVLEGTNYESFLNID